MAKNNQIESMYAMETVEEAIISVLLKGETAIIPDFGYLEPKFLSNRHTVLFKSTAVKNSSNGQSSEEGDSLQTLIYKFISLPLKEGKVVSFPKLGIFRPIKKEDSNFRVSYTSSTSFRKLLNGEKEEIKEEVKRIETPKTEITTGELSQDVITLTNKEKKEVLPVKSEQNTTRQRQTAKVGDVIIPQDEETPKKKRSLGGLMWIIGVCVVIIVVIATHIFTNNSNNKIENQPVSVTQSEIESEPRDLPALAEQHYGNSIFWVYIFEANRDKLTSPINIPKNVSLTIPDLSEYAVDIKDSMEIVRANMLSETILEQLKK